MINSLTVGLDEFVIQSAPGFVAFGWFGSTGARRWYPRHGEIKSASLTRAALEPNFSAPLLDHGANEKKTQSGSFFAAGCGLAANKWLENPRHHVGRDSRPVVRHAKDVKLSIGPAGNLDAAGFLVHVAHRVRNQIGED